MRNWFNCQKCREVCFTVYKSNDKYVCEKCNQEKKMEGLCASNEEESFKDTTKKIFDMILDLMKKQKPGSIEMEFCLNFIESYNNHGKYHDK